MLTLVEEAFSSVTPPCHPVKEYPVAGMAEMEAT
tara:strand:+ start:493 stop:594 length:102 start_codon:yes stop_codon:yes gene_type:complete